MVSNRLMRVVILGCGPAGIFAAHAAARLGVPFTIYSRKRRSEMFGAQYLHRPIPGLSVMPPETVMYSLMGTPEQYAQKVYGDERPEFVSPQSLVGKHQAWDIREAYYAGWAMYEDRIVHIDNIASPSSKEDREAVSGAIDDWPATQVISTIPAPLLCNAKGLHTFSARDVWAKGDAPERGQWVDSMVPPFEVICNGEKSPSWYRASNVFGYRTMEWPIDVKPPVSGLARVTKVIGTDCGCLQPKVWRAGRMGTWNKKAFSHHAFYTVDTALRLRLWGKDAA